MTLAMGLHLDTGGQIKPIEALRACLEGKLSVLVGPSGVGKSSLLNRIAGRRIAIVDPTSGVTPIRRWTTGGPSPR